MISAFAPIVPHEIQGCIYKAKNYMCPTHSIDMLEDYQPARDLRSSDHMVNLIMPFNRSSHLRKIFNMQDHDYGTYPS